MYRVVLKARQEPINYDILIGESILDEFVKFIKTEHFSKILIIADANAFDKYGPHLFDVCALTGIKTLVYPISETGRENKTLELCVTIYEWLAENRADRASLLIAFGGGVIGDIAGFVAATYMRGLQYVSIPTTLLSQVDSSIGGKTGFNFNNRINLIGTYYSPTLVLINTEYLATLPPREMLSGWGEIAKTMFIADKSTSLKLLEESLSTTSAQLLDIIHKCCKIKTRVVISDPKEKNRKRWVLNYGHTIGQAIESISDFQYSHGEAVSLGIVAASHVGELLGITSRATAQIQANILAKLGLPTAMSREQFRNSSARDLKKEILEATTKDKKSHHGRVNFVVLKDIGRPVLVNDVEESIIASAIEHIGTQL